MHVYEAELTITLDLPPAACVATYLSTFLIVIYPVPTVLSGVYTRLHN